MIIKGLILITIMFDAQATIGAPMSIEKQADCMALANQIKSDNFHKVFQNPIASLSQRYALVKKFSAGKGGAYVALARDVKDNVEKVVKIFPSISTESNKYNYRELFYTCLNGFITYKDLGISINNNPQSTSAFPRLYELGVTSAPALDGASGEAVYPYMVFEFIKGESLTGLGVRANENKNNIQYAQNSQYNFYNKNQKQSGSNNILLTNKQKTQAVLYQLVQILFKLKRININGKEYGFYHADLNPGNVMVRNTIFSGTMDAGYGAIRAQELPLLTMIDFGHSTSNFDDELGSKVNSLKTTFHKSLHFMSGSAEEFYKNLNDSALSKITEGLIGASGTDSDIRLYRVMARALFDSENYTNKAIMSHLNDCNTRTKCVEKAPALFRAP